MSPFPTLQDVVKAARQVLSASAWDYLVGGAETETTVGRNRLGLDGLALRPRVMRDVTGIDGSGLVLGAKSRIPVVLAPIGSLRDFDPGGAATVARAAEAFGVPRFVGWGAQGIEDAAVAGGRLPRAFTINVRGDERWLIDNARRARELGYTHLCLSCDTTAYGRRERDLMNRFKKTGKSREGEAALTWDHVERFREHSNLPLALKAVMSAEDAERAVRLGVQVVYVSNHGGRQLDHAPATIDVLPEIVAAVGGKAEVIVDGGFLRGTDVVKALALGAKAVGIGRLQAFGLAAGGEVGLVRVLELLEDEIKTALGLLGVTRTTDLDRSHVCKAAPVARPGLASAYPHVGL